MKFFNRILKMKPKTIFASKTCGLSRVRTVFSFKNAIDQDVVVRKWPAGAFKVSVDQEGEKYNLVITDEGTQNENGMSDVKTKYTLAAFENKKFAVEAMEELHGKLAYAGPKKAVKVVLWLALAFFVVSFLSALFSVSGQSGSSQQSENDVQKQSFNALPRSLPNSIGLDGSVVKMDNGEYRRAGDASDVEMSATESNPMETLTQDALKGLNEQYAKRQKQLSDQNGGATVAPAKGTTAQDLQFAAGNDINGAFAKGK